MIYMFYRHGLMESVYFLGMPPNLTLELNKSSYKFLITKQKKIRMYIKS
ncbi:hypothetical protein DOY81_000943, partial [Sarcophaga bullata]